jgi:hypothetical protein
MGDISQPHGQWRHLEVDATGRDRVNGWLGRLVIMLVGPRGRVGLATRTPNGHLPALFGGPFHLQLGACFFVRWIGTAVGVNPGVSLREEARLVVLVPQHQAAIV